MDHKVKRPFRYRNAITSGEHGYLARRLKVYARWQRMKARTNVIPLRKDVA